MDFAAGDRIDFSAIDANMKVQGDQMFQLIDGPLSKTPGQLNVSYDAVSDTTVVSGNVDTDTDAEFVVTLDGKVDLTSAGLLL